MRSGLRLMFLLGTLALACPAQAALVRLPLDPATAVVGFRAYAFGLLPMDGTFTRFEGTLSVDPASQHDCHIDITVDVGSLRMDNPAIREDALSPDMLDAAAFHTLAFSGTCDDAGIAGMLTLHGETRPLYLRTFRDGARYSAQAALLRRDWGIVGRPMLAGQTIRIRVSTVLPPGIVITTR